MTPNRNERMIPRDDKGRIISRRCSNPECDGILHYEGEGVWVCDGLLDPNDPAKELEACMNTHFNNEQSPQ